MSARLACRAFSPLGRERTLVLPGTLTVGAQRLSIELHVHGEGVGGGGRPQIALLLLRRAGLCPCCECVV